jgi:hypothetical protein
MGTISRTPPYEPNQSTFIDNFTGEQALQIDDTFFNAKSFSDVGLRNSVSLLNRYDEENGYLTLFTELDSHVEIGDKILISKISGSGNSQLDNFEDYKLSNDYPFTDFSQGYTVLDIDKNKNKIVIDKLFIDTIEDLDLTGHYISLIKGENGNISNSTLNATFWKNLKLNNCTINQVIFLNSESSGCTFPSKYSDEYKSLKRSILSDGIQITDNNFSFGYNYIGYENNENNYVFNSDIFKGNFYDTVISTDSNNIIHSGYFKNCIIKNYTILGGEFIDCIIDENCNWNPTNTESAIFDNSNGSDFKPDIWKNGVWYKGDFSGKTWEDGQFEGNSNTLFIDSIWEDGVFTNGIISASTWKDGTFSNGSIYYSDWESGILNNGSIYYSNWSGGTFDKGKLYFSTWYDGIMKTGDVSGCTWINGTVTKNATIYGTWFGGKFYGGKIYNSDWFDGTFYNGVIENCNWSGGTFYNGEFNNSNWYDGNWEDGDFNNSYWYDGTFNNGTINESYIKEMICNYGAIINSNVLSNYNIDFYSGIIKNLNLSGITGDFTFYNGVWIDGYFKGTWLDGYWNGNTWDSSSTPTSPPEKSTTTTSTYDKLRNDPTYEDYFNG